MHNQIFFSSSFVAGKSSKSGGWEKEWKFEFGGGSGKRNNPFSSGDGSGGDGRPNQQVVTGLALAASVAGLLMLSRSSSYREISWKEFVNDYLARGTVENLTVVNNKWVKIKTRTDSVETVSHNTHNIQMVYTICNVSQFHISIKCRNQHSCYLLITLISDIFHDW